MTVTKDQDTDALCNAARDIARHIAGMAEELAHLRHPHGTPSPELIQHQIVKIRDQITLLSGVVADIAKG